MLTQQVPLAALKSFINTKHEKKLVILGDMLELGNQEEKEHQQIVDFVIKNNLNTILEENVFKNQKQFYML